ncbi:MAG: hypothetical protein HUU15_05345 [Candidatus Brocadiae bacterium]|nr:hypothetical protein [Candidatus Brocadiia bacterium]
MSLAAADPMEAAATVVVEFPDSSAVSAAAVAPPSGSFSHAPRAIPPPRLTPLLRSCVLRC